MLNVNGIKRNAKNIVKKYSDAQVKVREATSNDPWGPSSTIMAEIADLTYNVVAFSEIMQMIWKRLNDHGKNWRHVYKALVLLEYLIKTGSDKVAQQCTENIFAIQTLKDFQFMDENKDHGMNIREKSKRLVALLKDSEKLKAERARALKAKARLAESMSSVSKNSLGLMMSSSMNGSDTPTSSTTNGNDQYHTNESGSSSSAYLQDATGSVLGPDLDSARPHSLTEEEQQLRLALALSKEEAEQQEKTRKNDELRLKLALDVSKKTASSAGSNLIDDFDEPSTSTSKQSDIPTTIPLVSSSTVPQAAPTQSNSAIDDLLGLSIPAPNEAQAAPNPLTSSAFTHTNPPPTLPVSQINSTTTAFAIPSSSSSSSGGMGMAPVFPEPSNDPWSVDPWKATGNTTGSPFASNLASTTPHQQAPINMLPLLTSTSTMPQIPIVGGAGRAAGGLFDDNTKRAMSKNPFQD